MSEIFRQDMPPQGGYKPINITRLPAKKYFNGIAMFVGYLGVTAISWYLYSIDAKRVTQQDVENQSAEQAIIGLLAAERDRAYLKQVRKNRDAEEDIMKDVKNWKVGTYYGEPVYKTIPSDTWIDVSSKDFYIHAHQNVYKKYNAFRFWDWLAHLFPINSPPTHQGYLAIAPQ